MQMSTFTIQSKTDTTPLDGPNDLKPVVKTAFMVRQEDAVKATEEAAKKKAAKKKAE